MSCPELIATFCTAYVKGNTPIHARGSGPDLLTRPSAFPPSQSKECQTLSWKTTHKYNCQRRDVLHHNDDAHNIREEKNLTSWLNAWTVSLCATATAALDLANHESDYLCNHWYVFRPLLVTNGNVETLVCYQASA